MESTTSTCSPTKRTLKAYFLPFLAPSHFIPLLQIAKLFASRGVHVTFLTTPHNSLLLRDLLHGPHPVDLDIVDFPSREVGLPDGIENVSLASTRETAGRILRAFFLLQGPMEDKVRAAKPDCIVADMHCFWASDLATQLNIPRLIYHGQAYFALCADHSVSQMKDHPDEFILPGLPDPIRMARSELHDCVRDPSHPYIPFVNKMNEGDQTSYGVLVNSFYNMEPAYADHYRNKLGRRAWCIGPLSVHCNAVLGNARKGGEKHPCIEWLDRMQAGKVVYVAFGSQARFSPAQLHEIALGLENSGYPFVWVVRKVDDEHENEKWFPDGFEARISQQNVGVIIKGWAPQVEVLEHPSVGGFVTSCGWNSVVEAVTAGLPMVTWPLSAEHFYNRRLVIHVLKTGVDVGNKRWGTMIDGTDEMVDKERIESAVREMMKVDSEGDERRRRAKELGEAAKKAVTDGGSSHENLIGVVEELKRLKVSTN